MTQNEALMVLTTGANAFLSGEPGSGKTHTTQAYIAWLRAHGIEPAITASTGIAATHIGGMTIHAWSGIGIREQLTAVDIDAIVSKEHVVRRIGKTKVLLIDEISMLSADVLTMVDRVMQEARGDTRPFGGVQVVFVGDFFQLPPVTRTGRDLVFAFESDAWKNANPLPLYLTEQYRHTGDALVGVLQNMRLGECDHTDISCILSREVDEADVALDVPRLYTHNADVDRINAKRLEELPGTLHTYAMEGSGAPALMESLKRGCLSPERLLLKEGAAVMFTKNNPLAGFSNGTLGIVTGFSRGSNSPIVTLRDGREITVEPQEWVVEENGKIRARISQVPLRLAWALTVHKSQGQSLDAAAIDLSKAFEYGQGYVALSRLRTLSGLYLLGFSEDALLIHPRVTSSDDELRRASEEVARVFTALHESGERERLEKNFILTSGGTLEKHTAHEKQSTYEATLVLMQEGKLLPLIAKERGLTLSTIADHAEKLVGGDRFSRKDLEELLPQKLRKSLEDIFAVFAEKGHERLAPIYSALDKRFTFEELKMARAAYRP